MSDDGTTTGESSHLTAAEYVLGVLGPAERRAAAQRMTHDQPFAEEVAFWEDRLGTLANAVTPVAPPARIIKRIMRAVDGNGVMRESLWRSLSFWRSFALGAAVAAAASVGALTFVEISPPRRAPSLAATLSASNGQPEFVATIDASGAMLLVPTATFAADPRVMELWLIPPGDKPRSLGLIDLNRTMRVNVPRDLVRQIVMDAALAVSLEPPGGSPTGQPTGPVLASGKLTSL
jgi:anti-sigma-K factor RskA